VLIRGWYRGTFLGLANFLQEASNWFAL
jgi:hypothetical protein